jgi:hypothetical protein
MQKVGARNQLKAQVTEIERGDVMAQIKYVIPAESVNRIVLAALSFPKTHLPRISNQSTITGVDRVQHGVCGGDAP